MTGTLSPHIKDLITAYQSMPQTTQRDKVLTNLKMAYLAATSDELTPVIKK